MFNVSPFHSIRTVVATAAMVLLAVAGLTEGAVAQKSVPSSAEEITLSFAPLVKQAAPAVVNIFTRKAVTVPLEPRQAAANYRGFHVNDWELCIGCSTCQKVCDNAAITMVKIPSLPDDPVKGVRNERPAIDYGRCCWCGLCVDICPTSSLSLTTEYVHTCREDELDSYFILPDPKGIHDQHFSKGWAKSEDADLVDLKRQPMEEMEAEEA